MDYIGSKTGIERELIGALPGVTYHGVSCGKLRRYFSWQNFVDPFRVLHGFLESREIIRRGPAGRDLQQGRLRVRPGRHGGGKDPGRRARVGLHAGARQPHRLPLRRPRVRHVCGHGQAHQRQPRRHTGTPIRPELYEGDAARALAFTGLSGEKPVLLVMGGSSGAQRLNELVRAALPRLLPVFDVIHLCGRGKVDAAAARDGYLQYEYIDRELPDLLALADVVLSRAGANAVFEFLALAKPAVLVPLPLSASRGDQIQNAKYFQDRGYAVMVDQDTATPDTIADAVAHVYENRLEYRANMTGDDLLDGTDQVLHEIRAAAALGRAGKARGTKAPHGTDARRPAP